jgi:hypothetical protein
MTDDLGSLQRRLAAALQLPEPIATNADATRLANEVAGGNEHLSPIDQVDIYREQFWLRHLDVLRDDFASIEHALADDDAWARLAREYLRACPSVSCSLRDLGERMVDFLESTPPWSDDPFLADLARVEWAFVEAFDGPDAPPFDPGSIVGVPEDSWPGARILLHPALQRLTLGSAAHDYRIHVRKAKETGEALARPEPQPVHVVVYRGPELLHCLEIGDDAAALLAELERGVALGAACEAAAATSGTDLESFQAKLAGWFSEWTALGWIRAVAFP